CPRRAAPSSGCSRWATIWDCSPRNTTFTSNGCAETSRRPSLTWRSSMPYSAWTERCCSGASAEPWHNAPHAKPDRHTGAGAGRCAGDAGMRAGCHGPGRWRGCAHEPGRRDARPSGALHGLGARGARHPRAADRAYGDANLELQAPDTTQTRYRLGSISKQFTAAAILLLQERGLLKVQDPVGRYLPDAPAAWAAITLQNLLTHTSGIPSYSDLPGFDATKARPATPAQLVARFRDLPLLFAPGTAWRYSNSNYALLGYLIERISGQSYAQFLQQNIFTPLGMRQSGYDSTTQLIMGRAEGYTPGEDHDAPVNAPYIDMSVPYAAGGLYSTTHDLLRWEQALYGMRLLSASSLRQMTTPYMSDYGFGLTIRTLPGGQLLYSHGGGIYGF